MLPKFVNVTDIAAIAVWRFEQHQVNIKMLLPDKFLHQLENRPIYNYSGAYQFRKCADHFNVVLLGSFFDRDLLLHQQRHSLYPLCIGIT